MQRRLDHAGAIEQVKGMLMLVEEIDADEAFTMMRAYARPRHMTVYDVARWVIDTDARLALKAITYG